MLEQTLSTLETVLKDVHSPVSKKLQNGLDVAIITTSLEGVDINNQDLVKLYRWKNGTMSLNNEVIGKLKLFSHGIFLSLSEAIEHYKSAQLNLLWKSRYFPIFTSGGGDFLLLETQKEQGGKIFLYSPALLLSDEVEDIYENLDVMFQTITACYKAGAYSYNDDNFLEVDYNLEESISQQMNQDIQYWN